MTHTAITTPRKDRAALFAATVLTIGLGSTSALFAYADTHPVTYTPPNTTLKVSDR